MRTAVLLTGSHEAGQDLLQAALERLIRHWGTRRGDPEGYLRRTLYNLAVAGQSFDITGVPNGTYYIQVIANPLHVLHETTTGNDISVRKVILNGTKGHRQVNVPAWHGIDPEPR